MRSPLPRGLLTAVSLPLLVACTANAAATDAGGAIQVTSTDQACDLSTVSAPSGVVRFQVTNKGSQVTEFYLKADDGLRILGEVENIGPGLTRDLIVTVPAGQYQANCKPGMAGAGQTVGFAVSESGAELVPTGQEGELLAAATTAYASYVTEQSEQLLEATKEFADRYTAGDDDAARAAYAPTRMHWERIEPVAESFGDLDPALDLREADLEPGQKWTGWHAIEKDLWPPAGYEPRTQRQRERLAQALVADTVTLARRVRTLEYTPAQLGNGAKELLDEVATGKVTGEEEAWSHTDLWDFQANLEGARIAFEGLQPVVQVKDPELAKTLTTQFAAVQELLDAHRSGTGFVLYTELSSDQVKESAVAVDALGEPLSQLTSTVVG